jgi:hypothetical protein
MNLVSHGRELLSLLGVEISVVSENGSDLQLTNVVFSHNGLGAAGCSMLKDFLPGLESLELD